MTRPLCIYHANCLDGFTAAWVVRRRMLGDCDFYAAQYGGVPPAEAVGRQVIIVDFSYSRPVLERLAEVNELVTVLDHHKSAAEDLAGLPQPEPWGTTYRPGDQLTALFDMDRSGAGIAWDYFIGGKRPALVDHVEDRDLWHFALPGTREVAASMSSYPYEFHHWDRMSNGGIASLVADGAGILRKHDLDVRHLVEATRCTMRIGGYDVPVANMPFTMASDAGNLLAQAQPFAATYSDTAEHRIFSLRSTPQGEDVSRVAKLYGGGGHRNAAGFRMPRGWEGDGE